MRTILSANAAICYRSENLSSQLNVLSCGQILIFSPSVAGRKSQVYTPQPMATKFFAFISYNSHDAAWGKRLQRKLEH